MVYDVRLPKELRRDTNRYAVGITYYLRNPETRRLKENSKLRRRHERLRLQDQRLILYLAQTLKQL